jgi:predicted helicase
MNFSKIINKYRDEAQSLRDQGDKFEKLIRGFLSTYQVYDHRFSHVWLWKDFPYKSDVSLTDTGIDLVAETVDSEYWAVQCKCYQEDTPITKRSLDSFLSTSSKFFKDSSGKNTNFTVRLLVSTSNNWGSEAENSVRNQTPPVSRLSLADLEEAAVDWEKLDNGIYGPKARTPHKILKEHQVEAIEAFHNHFKNNDRGKLILPCGTGKTLTGLKIAEKETGGKGVILYLAPSIALVAQTLKSWSSDAKEPIFGICVCSDAEVSRGFKILDDEDDHVGVEDLALPASTDPNKIANQLEDASKNIAEGLCVVFSTYHSISVVSEASLKAKITFDLAIFDEAHVTAGSSRDDTDKSHFITGHYTDVLKAKKRLYMTATPRVYTDNVKKKAEESSVIVYSMDDESIYGPEVYYMGFGTAVDKGLLSDYKVLVLTVKQSDIPDDLMKEIADGKKEINTDDATKLIGCINALSKMMDLESVVLSKIDPEPMKKAVAFCRSISISKRITNIFNKYAQYYYNAIDPSLRYNLVTVVSDHVDGSMGTAKRNKKLSWLNTIPDNSNECHILTNAKCLSIGVDVPSLDAVIFLSSKSSDVDIVQCVGRVMRLSPGKKYGYIIIPVLVPPNVNPEEALKDHATFGVIWDVVNALKSHDDRIISMINRIRFNDVISVTDESVLIGGVAKSLDTDGQNQLIFPQPGKLFSAIEFQKEFRKVVYARLAQKIGNRNDVANWAKNVGNITKIYADRINRLIEIPGHHKDEFDKFLEVLRKNLNPSVQPEELVRMLSQHMVTKPVFESLFKNYSFSQNNPVSIALQKMVDLLEAQAFDKDRASLDQFYSAADKRIAQQFVSGIDNASGRQKIIVDLYNNFFKIAFPDVVERLGIVYTPVELVDFINNSVSEILKKEFKRDISDENVHILDPFTGTGTFIVRLIQSGLLGESLERKYLSELHANEMVLLAYYIASINIENAYHDALGENEGYKPFNGICLTDTFQLFEDDKGLVLDPFLLMNSERVDAQKKTPIMVIIGNPPYSVGQRSANDNAKNLSYKNLDTRISETYGSLSAASLKKSIYDSYVKAFRWSTDRIIDNNGGIIAFVSNAGWLDGNSTDGMRKCLASEFSSIYVLNLRGNALITGESRRKEKDNVFGRGTRTPISISFLIKNPNYKGQASIYYSDIGDYLFRKEKLKKVYNYHDIYSSAITWKPIIPNESGDWLNQRNESFSSFISLGDKKEKNISNTIFKPFYSLGLTTGRDSWCYNFSKVRLEENIIKSIDFYNNQVSDFISKKKSQPSIKAEDFINRDSKFFSWDALRIRHINNAVLYKYQKSSIVDSLYRPFERQFCYYSRDLNSKVFLMPFLFPTKDHKNLLICISGIGVTKEFSAIITDIMPDLELLGKSQCFPRYYYEKNFGKPGSVFNSSFYQDDEYIRQDCITDYILKECQTKYREIFNKIDKDSIFYYVYGLLHSKDYKETFSFDLKKMIPRIPLVDDARLFEHFSKAGRDLAELHLNYEDVDTYPDVIVTGDDKGDFTVNKMEFGKGTDKKDDKSVIYYNSQIMISNIPLKAYEYKITGKSAIEWIMDRYQDKVDQDTQIRNNPNDWSLEHDNPRYILDLLLRIITLSMKTVQIVDNLPKLEF